MIHQSDSDYLARATAREMLATSDPHQKALLRILAMCHEHGIAAIQPIRALGYELGHRSRWKILDFASKLETDSFLDAINQSHQAISPHSLLALNLAVKNGTLGKLYSALQDLSLGRDPIEMETNFYSRFFRLTLKVFFVFGIMGFIAIRVIPEFVDMLGEFGIQRPPVVDMMMTAVNAIPIILAVYFLLILMFAFYSGNVFRRFLRRWSPTKWRQPFVDKSANKLRGLALISQPPFELNESVKLIRKQEYLNRQYLDFVKLERTDSKWVEAARLGVVNPKTFNALQATDNFETKAWLLRWASQNRIDHKKTGADLLMRVLFSLVNAVIAFIVALAALSVFSVLFTIIESLGK